MQQRLIYKLLAEHVCLLATESSGFFRPAEMKLEHAGRCLA